MSDSLNTRFAGQASIPGCATRGNGRPHLLGPPAIQPTDTNVSAMRSNACNVPVPTELVLSAPAQAIQPWPSPSPQAVKPAGQVATGPSFPGQLGLDQWTSLSSLDKVDFLVRNAGDRQALADALTYGLENGYPDIAASVGLAERALFVAPSGQVQGQVAPSGCGCAVPPPPSGHMPIHYHGGSISPVDATRELAEFFAGQRTPAQMIAPSAQAIVPTSAETPAPAPAPAPGMSGTTKAVVWVGAGAVSLTLLYMLLREKPHPTYGFESPEDVIARKKKYEQWGVEYPKKPTY